MAYVQTPDLANNPVASVKAQEIADQLNLVPTELRAPVYGLRRFSPIQGSAPSITTSTSLSQWQLAGDAIWNFYKSFITFDFALPTGGAGLYQTLLTDCLPIDSIQLQTSSGQVIAQIQNAQIYTKVSQALACDLADYQTRGGVYVNDTSFATAKPRSQITGLHAAGLITGGADAVVNRATEALSSIGPSDAQMTDSGAGVLTVSASPATAVEGTDIPTRYPPQRFATQATANTIAVARFKIPLKAYVGTLLAMNKDLYFGQNLQLSVNWAPVDRWGFKSQIDATTGLVALIPAATAMSNLALYKFVSMPHI